MITANNIDTWEEYLRLRYPNKNTYRQYMVCFKRYSLQGNLLSQQGINAFLSHHNTPRGSPNNQVTRAFCKALKQCFKIEAEIPMPRSRKGKRIHKFLSKEQIDYIIENSTTKTSLLVKLFFETGLRLNELINIKQEGINIDTCSLKGIGKGNVDFEERISKNTLILLLQYLKKVPTKKYPFHYPNVKVQNKKFWYELKKECVSIGIPNMTPHRIRHSLGHHLRAEVGFDLEEIREKLRHVKLETTRIYATATKEEVEKKMREEVFKEI